MADSQIEDIKTRLNIVDVVSDYVRLKKSGANFKVTCPFHKEKSASFYVSPARQIWHCFGCGLGGDVIEFVKQMEQVSFPEALSLLGARAGIEVQTYRPTVGAESPDSKKVLYRANDLAASYYHKVLLESKAGSAAREYLKKRNITDETIKLWRIGYAPEMWDTAIKFLLGKGLSEKDIVSSGIAVRTEGGKIFDRFRDRITFPISDPAGRVVGLAGRILTPRDDVGKYINSPESPIYNKSRVLFGYFQARNVIRKDGIAVVVEGNLDVIKSSQSGVKNVVASSGTALTEGHLSLLARLCENLKFAFDTDSAGEEATGRALRLAVRRGFDIDLIKLPQDFKDPDEAIDKDPEIWSKAVKDSKNYLDFYFSKLFDIIDLNDARVKKESASKFLNFLALVPDKIVQSHYVKLLAEKISVKEFVVFDLLNQRQQADRPLRQETRTAEDKQTVQRTKDVLEDRFLGLLGLYPSLFAKVDPVFSPDLLRSPIVKELYEYLKGRSHGPEPEKAQTDNFTDLATEPKTKLQELIFLAETEFPEPSAAGEAMQQIIRRLHSRYYDERKQEMTGKITQSEKAANPEAKQKQLQDYEKILKEQRDKELEISKIKWN